MAKTPIISDAEWEIMAILWEKSPISAMEVIDALKDRRDWNPKTIRTLLGRLVKKRAIEYSAQGNRYFYRPRLTRDACVKMESRSFVSRVFGDAVGPMLVHFVRQANLSREEIEQLEKLLREKSNSKER
jgi:BlaI family penicillinase repressor